jgi:hypothetical protein
MCLSKRLSHFGIHQRHRLLGPFLEIHSLGWSLRICMPNRFPGGTEAGLATTL